MVSVTAGSGLLGAKVPGGVVGVSTTIGLELVTGAAGVVVAVGVFARVGVARLGAGSLLSSAVGTAGPVVVGGLDGALAAWASAAEESEESAPADESEAAASKARSFGLGSAGGAERGAPGAASSVTNEMLSAVQESR